MSLYTEWRNLSDNHESQEAEVKFWEAYLQAEASIYNDFTYYSVSYIRKKCRNIFIYYIKVFTDIFYIPVKAFVFYNIKNTS